MNQRIVIAACSVLALVLGLVGVWVLRPKPDLTVDRVIFVTIDTLRADHLRSHGYPIDTMPFLTDLSARGTSFTRTYAHSSTTGPSHASMFTSLYPMQHQVTSNGEILDEDFVTLAEVLDASGVETAAFVSGMRHFGASQIAQGFAHYDQPSHWDKQARVEYRPAEETTELAAAWLGAREPDERFLTWVHYFDPHPPYQAPERFTKRTLILEDNAKFRRFIEREHDLADQPEKRRALKRIRAYDAEVMYVDEQLERLFEAVEARGFEGRTLWVITSDHGEGLGNHNFMGHHVQIYNNQLHVPLVFYFSDGAAALGSVDDQLVGHVDLTVTLAELMGVEFSGQIAPIQGKSLVPILAGSPPEQLRAHAFSERRVIRADVHYARGKQREEPGERYALQGFDHKYIAYTEGTDEFYEVSVDPYESTNLIEAPSKEKDVLREELEAMVSTLRGSGRSEVVDEETLKGLEALGYTD